MLHVGSSNPAFLTVSKKKLGRLGMKNLKNENLPTLGYTPKSGAHEPQQGYFLGFCRNIYTVVTECVVLPAFIG